MLNFEFTAEEPIIQIIHDDNGDDQGPSGGQSGLLAGPSDDPLAGPSAGPSDGPSAGPSGMQDLPAPGPPTEAEAATEQTADAAQETTAPKTGYMGLRKGFLIRKVITKHIDASINMITYYELIENNFDK